MRLLYYVAVLSAAFVLVLGACGPANQGLVVSKPGKCVDVSGGDFDGTKAAGEACTQSSECKKVDCTTTNECRTACIDKKCDGPAVCNR